MFFLLLTLLLQTFYVAGQQKKTGYVILISFDGFRSDYVERFKLPNFKAFIKNGAAAEALIPSFPSKTFPNHYTLVTGLYPGHHGLVDNHFYDPAKKQVYTMKDKAVVTDSSYYGGVPLWQLARNNGIKSASYFWVGSELSSEKLRPDYYFPYNQSVPFEDRVDQVITWLKLPEKERPHLITLYFSSPDSESHTFGPMANETKEKLLSIDSLLGKFMQKIKGTGIDANIILVSDHGMLEIRNKEENYILLDDLINTKGKITVVNGGTQVHVYTGGQAQKDSLFRLLTANAKTFTVLRRENFPAVWRYNHPRAGDLLLVANPGKYFVTGDRNKLLKDIELESENFGAHGYDPTIVNDMYGIFYASGPNIKAGVTVKAFQNIHVYPLIANILGISIPPIDGSLEPLAPVYLNK